MIKSVRSMSSHKKGLPKLLGVVFDMDGTLTIPNIDFTEMYNRCGVPLSKDLLVEISKMSNAEQLRANAVIDEMEAEGRRTLELGEGVVEFAKWLKYYDIPVALVTRNTQTTIDHFHRSLWEPLGLPRFSPAISRDSPSHLPAKPDPAAMHYILQEWGVFHENKDNNNSNVGILMVGDSFKNDILFGKAAGVATALVDSGRRYVEGAGEMIENKADFHVDNIALLPHLLWQRYEVGNVEDSQSSNRVSANEKYPAPAPPESALDIAASMGDVSAVEKNLKDVRMGSTSKGVNSAIIWATEGGHNECVKAIIRHYGDTVERQAILDHEGYLGATAVSRAARRGYSEVLSTLLSAGATPDTFNVKLQAPLHFAAFQRHAECVDILLKHGANTWLLDQKGRTAAEDTKDEGIRKAILRARSRS